MPTCRRTALAVCLAAIATPVSAKPMNDYRCGDLHIAAGFGSYVNVLTDKYLPPRLFRQKANKPGLTPILIYKGRRCAAMDGEEATEFDMKHGNQ